MHRIHLSYNSTSKSFGTRADNSNYRRHHRPAALYTHTGSTQDCSYFVYIPPLSLHIYMAHVHWLFSFSFHQGLVWDICITIAHTTGRQALKHFILVRTALLLRYISYEHDITSARASKHGRTFWVVYQRHFHTNLAIPYTHCSH
jgi:hypothetical protein